MLRYSYSLLRETCSPAMQILFGLSILHCWMLRYSTMVVSTEAEPEVLTDYCIKDIKYYQISRLSLPCD